MRNIPIGESRRVAARVLLGGQVATFIVLGLALISCAEGSSHVVTDVLLICGCASISSALWALIVLVDGIDCKIEEIANELEQIQRSNR